MSIVVIRGVLMLKKYVIEQKEQIRLPDFRNAGVIARVMVTAIMLRLASATSSAENLPDAFVSFVNQGVHFELTLLIGVLTCYAFAPHFKKMTYGGGGVLLAVIAFVLGFSSSYLLSALFASQSVDRHVYDGLLAAVVAAFVLLQLHWMHLKTIPLQANARFAALASKINPHFFFNCINSCISLVAISPIRAQTFLENFALLFREALENKNNLIPLSRDLELMDAYMAIQRDRYEDRLVFDYIRHTSNGNCSVPVFFLQGLLDIIICEVVEKYSSITKITIDIKEEDFLCTMIFHVLNPEIVSDSTAVSSAMEVPKTQLLAEFKELARLSTVIRNGVIVVNISMPLA